MTNNSDAVRKRYGKSGLLQRITKFLQDRGVDPEQPNYQDYFPFDQLHGRGIQATRQHIENAGIKSNMHVLDLGCGVGGCSRVISATCGCRVSGIDLTPEFIEVARELTRRCGMADHIEFRQANALELPYPEATFDHVWCHNVTMNIEDKGKFASEVARVLKPGGRFSCSEVGQGPGGPPNFPLPWAMEESASFLVTPEEMRQALERSGLQVTEEIDLSEAYLAFAREMRARAERGDPPLNANYVVMGDDISQCQTNAVKCVLEKRLVEHYVIAEKR
jgi:ubiquinone/menaquinone biosynthesis C-methylase UbiE